MISNQMGLETTKIGEIVIICKVMLNPSVHLHCLQFRTAKKVRKILVFFQKHVEMIQHNNIGLDYIVYFRISISRNYSTVCNANTYWPIPSNTWMQ